MSELASPNSVGSNLPLVISDQPYEHLEAQNVALERLAHETTKIPLKSNSQFASALSPVPQKFEPLTSRENA
jgi:hypothetical protein